MAITNQTILNELQTNRNLLTLISSKLDFLLLANDQTPTPPRDVRGERITALVEIGIPEDAATKMYDDTESIAIAMLKAVGHASVTDSIDDGMVEILTTIAPTAVAVARDRVAPTTPTPPTANDGQTRKAKATLTRTGAGSVAEYAEWVEYATDAIVAHHAETGDDADAEIIDRWNTKGAKGELSPDFLLEAGAAVMCECGQWGSGDSFMDKADRGEGNHAGHLMFRIAA